MTKDEIKALAAEYGFTLNQDFCDFANRLLKTQSDKMRTEGWRQCAQGQNTTQFCGQLEAAVKAEREACAGVVASYDDPDWAHLTQIECTEAILARRDGG